MSDDGDGRDDAELASSGGRSRRSCWWPTTRCHPTCWPSCSSGRWPTSSGGAASWPTSYRREAAGSSWCASPAATATRRIADLAPYVERFLLHDQRARLSGAALETLAIVAYKQPISRAQIASIRGVDPDGVMRTLQCRAATSTPSAVTAGPARRCSTAPPPSSSSGSASTRSADLPPLAEFIPGADVVEALEAGLRVSDARTE